MNLIEYTTEQLDAEIKRRRALSDQFATIDKRHSSDTWVVTARDTDRDYIVGYYCGNPIDIALILGPRGYGLVFTPVNFKEVTPQHLTSAEPKPSSFQVVNVDDTNVQRYFNHSELFGKLSKSQKAAVGIVRSSS